MVIKRFKLSVSYCKAHIFLYLSRCSQLCYTIANSPKSQQLTTKDVFLLCNMIVRVSCGSPLHRLHSVTQEDKATPLTPWPRIDRKEKQSEVQTALESFSVQGTSMFPFALFYPGPSKPRLNHAGESPMLRGSRVG